jgi:hypothetical protein
MKKIFFLSILVFSLKLAANPYFQDSLFVNRNDVKTVDAIVAALYQVISGPAGETRNWNRMRSLFLPEAKLVATGQRPNGELVKRVMTVEEYILKSGPVLEKNGFFETEIARKQEVYGHIAHCFSTYESKRVFTDTLPFMRGINSIQLYFDGKRWWILSVLWQSENADLPIPKQYLNK